MTAVKRATLIFALLTLVLLVLAYVWHSPSVDTEILRAEPAVAAPAGAQTGAAKPNLDEQQHPRYLVSVVLGDDPKHSRAHIVGVNATGMYNPRIRQFSSPSNAITSCCSRPRVTGLSCISRS